MNRRRNVVSQREPTDRVFLLLGQSQFRLVVGVQENVRVRLEVRLARFEEAKMLARNEIEPPGVSVGIQCRIAAAIEPELKVGAAIPGVKHHLIVIPKNGNQSASLAESNELIEDALGVDSPIYVIT